MSKTKKLAKKISKKVAKKLSKKLIKDLERRYELKPLKTKRLFPVEQIKQPTTLSNSGE